MNSGTIKINSSKKNKKIVFDEDGEAIAVSEDKFKKEKSGKKSKRDFAIKRNSDTITINNSLKSKKIIFDEDGEVITVSENQFQKEKSGQKRKRDDGGAQSYKERRRPKGYQVDDENQAWYLVYTEFNTNSELVELKETELKALNDTCKSSFEAEHSHQLKKNPSDAKWLETALHKGTAKDRVNAGALLVHSNPLANLSALDTLIGLCKISNRTGPEVLTVLSELFMEALLPSDRKLLQLSLRGADWKALRKREDITKEAKNKIYAYWHFESELKDLYFEFLKNLQNCIQSGQDSSKNTSIVCASKLLCKAPEKEQMLLSMLINKLGDPSNKIASKALHHLSEVTFKHPNMCGVITNETEKLLFRNNISERAQHFALCFLAQIAPRGHPDVCAKLVNICFSFFKVLVKKGAVNNKTMQAILRCLQKAIVDAKPATGSTEIMTKEMQDTIYRLIHLADIRIAIQTLSLLLQLVAVSSEKSDRFYNALYKKLLDLNLTTMGTKTAAQFLHIVHRAIHIDSNVSRSLAFIKRLLQISLYMPTHVTCGCLVVVNKILKSRPELRVTKVESIVEKPAPASEMDLSRFDSDDEEDAGKEKKSETVASWHHANIMSAKRDGNDEEKKVKSFTATEYDPYHRVPAFAGAELAINSELNFLREHFHPTCKVFAETIVDGKPIGYYGDPLRDFSLGVFLERFAFKNPKKLNYEKSEESKTAIKSVYNKTYTAHGGRGQPVKSLTKDTCTEDELFIFNYLEKKRERQVVKKDADKHDDDDEDDDAQSVDDDEFESYLDGLCKKPESQPDEDEEDDFDIDFLKEMGTDLKFDETTNKKKKRGTKARDDEDDSDAAIDDWEDGNGEDEDDDESIEEADDVEDDEELGSGDEGSISLDEGSYDEESDDDAEEIDSLSEGSMDEDDESSVELDEHEPKSKKLRNSKNFDKALKGSRDISSLFAAADDFAELLEESSKDKRHGTSKEIFNTDKSSEKQLKWEDKRRQAMMGRNFKNKSKFKSFGKKGKK